MLTIPSLSGEAVETYSLRVANSWGLGYRGIDNGMLVLVAVQEHAVRIELGKGMERYFSNQEAKSIIDEVMAPEFRKGYFCQDKRRRMRPGAAKNYQRLTRI